MPFVTRLIINKITDTILCYSITKEYFTLVIGI